MQWIDLTSVQQLEDIVKENFSSQKPLAIFKHSTRCSISDMAKNRLERKWSSEQPMDVFYLDLIKYREVSNAIALKLDVEHESPQILVLKEGKIVLSQSHQSISPEEIATYR